MVTRGSPLALLQAEEVAVRLRGLGAEVKVVPMRTEGDRRAAARLVEIGGVCDGHRSGWLERAVGTVLVMPAVTVEEILCERYGIEKARLPHE